MNSRFDLTDNRALITGGTKGIGLAIAEEFLAFGAQVTIVARNAAEVQKQVEDWQGKGLKAFGLAADMSSVAGRKEAIDFAVGKMGAIDSLINNVGTNNRKSTLEYTLDEYQALLATNLTSVFEMCRLAHPHLVKGGKGSIVNIGSIAGITAVPTGSIYGMTKAAIAQLTKNLAVEWAKDRIRVNCIAPGFIRTPLTKDLLANQSFVERAQAQIPLGRVGESFEIGGLAAFLCMPSGGYITGETVVVDGGFTTKGI
ncbi:MAG: glucose 1-dehydrogenase [Cyanobacteria bacterium REEB67]|nr:glucose 1-dehydrogenase [Cyanobacteria bacterium REEB67]